MPRKIEDIRVVYAGFFVAFIVGVIFIVKMAHDVMVVYPAANKLEFLLESKSEYGNALKYVKAEGKVTALYTTRYGIYFSITPTIFNYINDSIEGKKVFYKEKHNDNVWFCLRGEDEYDLKGLKPGDFIKTDFGDSVFTIVENQDKEDSAHIKKGL